MFFFILLGVYYSDVISCFMIGYDEPLRESSRLMLENIKHTTNLLPELDSMDPTEQPLSQEEKERELKHLEYKNAIKKITVYVVIFSVIYFVGFCNGG